MESSAVTTAKVKRTTLRRWIGKVFVWGSSLMSVGFIVLFVISAWRVDRWVINYRSVYHAINTPSGFELTWLRRYELREDFNQRTPLGFEHDTTGRLLAYDGPAFEHSVDLRWRGWRDLFRFEWTTYDATTGEFLGADDWTISYRIHFPHWCPIILFALPFTITTISARRRRKREMIGHSQTCGYDLRASPVRCPECGGVVDLKISQAVGTVDTAPDTPAHP